jgi:hypothetical protein
MRLSLFGIGILLIGCAIPFPSYSYNNLVFSGGLKIGLSTFDFNYNYTFKELVGRDRIDRFQPLFGAAVFITNNEYVGLELAGFYSKRKFRRYGSYIYEVVEGVPQDASLSSYWMDWRATLHHLFFPMLVRISLPWNFYIHAGFGLVWIIAGEMTGTRWDYVKQELLTDPAWEEQFANFDVNIQYGFGYFLDFDDLLKNNAKLADSFLSHLGVTFDLRGTYTPHNMELNTRFETWMIHYHIATTIWVRFDFQKKKEEALAASEGQESDEEADGMETDTGTDSTTAPDIPEVPDQLPTSSF